MMAITCALIVESVAQYYNVSVEDILSNRRATTQIGPRHVSFWMARKLTLQSLPQIGRYMGNRDHTTVLHGIRRIDEIIKIQPLMQAELNEIETIICAAEDTINIIGGFSLNNYDPVEIAKRITNEPLTRQKVSVQELRCLARSVLNDAIERQEMEGTLTPDIEHPLAQPVRHALKAHTAWKKSQFTMGEKASFAAFETAFMALKTAFETKEILS